MTKDTGRSRAHRVVSILSLCGVVLLAATASAGTSFAPSGGHPTTESERNKFKILDARVCNQDTSGGDYYWSTPLSYNSSKSEISACVSIQGYTNSDWQLYSTNASGSLYAWTGWLTGGACSDEIAVVSTGTAFVKTELTGQWESGKAPGCVSRITTFEQD